jgi:hypothetical protein
MLQMGENIADNTKKTYELEVILKQETPIIHFQAEEYGAIIRGSELKPKLDKYLECNGVNVNKWKLNEQSGALDYKVRITVSGEPVRSFTKKEKIEWKETHDEAEKIPPQNKVNKMYFGKLQSVFYEDDIKVIFTSFVPGLLETIEENIETFFWVTNFGARQSKGFGGFTVTKINGQDVTKNRNVIERLESIIKGNDNGITVQKDCHLVDFFYIDNIENEESNGVDENTDEKKYTYINCLNMARCVYAAMRGGIRAKDEEIKDDENKTSKKAGEIIENGFIFEYKHEEYLNEKDYLKQEYREDEKNYRFMGAMLGLPVKYKITNKGTTEDKILKFENKIERFQSPIFIKIVEGYVIFFLKDSCKDIQNQKIKDENIKTPSADEFKLPEFINRFINYFNDIKENIQQEIQKWEKCDDKELFLKINLKERVKK